ncbi:MAG: hypothetical protein Q6366_000445, partial [Candidatus Freyarchaeota archaeon]
SIVGVLFCAAAYNALYYENVSFLVSFWNVAYFFEYFYWTQIKEECETACSDEIIVGPCGDHIG